MENPRVPKVVFVQKTPEKTVFKKYFTDGAWDLPQIDQDLTINPQEIVMINTGTYVAIPENFVGIIRERSSIQKRGIKVLGGVIDQEYRGEIVVIITNVGKEPVTLQTGTRIQQILIVPVLLNAEIKTLDQVDESFFKTNRGQNGFGSTG